MAAIDSHLLLIQVLKSILLVFNQIWLNSRDAVCGLITKSGRCNDIFKCIKPTYLFFTPGFAMLPFFTNHAQKLALNCQYPSQSAIHCCFENSFRPEMKKVSAHMKISGRPENSDRPEKPKRNSGRPEFHFACFM